MPEQPLIQNARPPIPFLVILSIIFEIVFFTRFFIDMDLIGVINLSRPFTVEFGIFITVYLIIVILAMLITGIIFAQKSIKLEDREVILKGKLKVQVHS